MLLGAKLLVLAIVKTNTDYVEIFSTSCGILVVVTLYSITVIFCCLWILLSLHHFFLSVTHIADTHIKMNA